jgi:hypothetical protein
MERPHFFASCPIAAEKEAFLDAAFASISGFAYRASK